MKTASIGQLLTLLLCLFSTAMLAQSPATPIRTDIKPKIDRPIKIDTRPQIPIIKLEADLVVENFTIGTATSHSTINGVEYYQASFSATVRNKGTLNAGTFNVSFFVNDYSHPASGDGWWYNATHKQDKIELKDVPNNLAANGYLPLTGNSKNTVVVNALARGTSLNITGKFLIKKTFIDHYHITAAADAGKGVTRYSASDGNIHESNEYNNTAKVIPRD